MFYTLHLRPSELLNILNIAFIAASIRKLIFDIAISTFPIREDEFKGERIFLTYWNFALT